MSPFDELEQERQPALFGLPRARQANNPSGGDNIARFCEHDGIFIHFSRARSSWQALATGALKPWWLTLKPFRATKQAIQKARQQNKNTNNKKNAKIEVTENA